MTVILPNELKDYHLKETLTGGINALFLRIVAR
jgi:hypothetical protein